MIKVSNIFGLVIVVVLAYVALNYQALADDYALETFHPSTQMASIISQLDLTHLAKGVLYRAKPQLDDDAAFNRDCQPGQGDVELGCYYKGRIYVLQITNPSLSSEMTVITAYEMLHSVYERLSAKQTQQMDDELEQAYSGIHDSFLAGQLSLYAVSEPGARDNELHSMLGTEYGTLPAVLEQHYALYFGDRAAIVQIHEQYLAVFANQLAQITAELAQINSLKGQLDQLNAELDSYKANEEIATYNSLVPQQNALVDQVNNLITTYQANVAEYNELSVSLESEPIASTNVPTVK